jgi:3-deoxy-manno-octulosonate cytidylyltransferase (CMP-KDO synthetase)
LPNLSNTTFTQFEHTYENAKKSGAATVIIATDDKRIEKVANGFGATTCMTNEAHTSGTARIAQVLEMLGIDDEQIIVNVQGDEPIILSSIHTKTCWSASKCNMYTKPFIQHAKLF